MASALPLDASTDPATDAPAPGAYWSVLLLVAINLFNYVDRYVFSAVELEIEREFPHVTQAQIGSPATVFLLSYTLISPLFGWLAERINPWGLVGIGVVLWSLASRATPLPKTSHILLFPPTFLRHGC